MKRALKWILGIFLVFCVAVGLLSQGGKKAPSTVTPAAKSVVVESTATDRPTQPPKESTATATSAPAAVVAPTDQPAPGPSETPTGPAAMQNANLRGGPGTGFEKQGSVRAGESLEIVGRNPAGDWYQLSSGLWIAAFLVRGAPSVPVAAMIPSLPTAAPAALRSAPVDRGLPSAGVSNCDCNSGDSLNCPDFADAWDAQACFLRCKELTGRDVHGLDRDKDDSACEWEY